MLSLKCGIAQEQDDTVLQEEIVKAHVICIIYDITQENSFDRVSFMFVFC
jgi:hypothetical protein